MFGIIEVVFEYFDRPPTGISAPKCPVKRIGNLDSPKIMVFQRLGSSIKRTEAGAPVRSCKASLVRPHSICL